MGAFAVVFDLDGTLADTLADIGGAVNHALASVGMPTHGAESYRHWVGHGWFNLVRQAAGPSAEDRHGQLVEVSWAYYQDHLTDHTRLYDGVQAVLDELAARGVPMAVLTNKPHHLAVAIVERLGCADRFVAVQGAQGDDLKKPQRAISLRVLDALAAAPQHTYMVGDSEVDVETADQAGMISASVSWGFRSRDELVQAGARHVLDRVDQILALPGLTGR